MSVLLYGAYGYTGRLITKAAVRRGHRPLLAGRDADALQEIATATECPARPFPLSDRAALDAALEDVDAVLHCAGPFVHTAAPMVAACLRTATHYLDITGEIEVLESIAARGAEAQKAGIVLCPAVGFDVVPTDCVAAQLHAALPEATAIELAIQGLGRLSRGTLRTAIEQLGEGGIVRRNGRLQSVPTAWTTRTVDFGDGPKVVVSIPWGDIATAYRSTGIPNITTYAQVGPRAVQWMRRGRRLEELLGAGPIQNFLKGIVSLGADGPSADQRAAGATRVWGRATTDEAAATMRMHGPEGYTFTARAALAAVEHVLNDAPPAGYHTPSSAFGPDFAERIEGVTTSGVEREGTGAPVSSD
jgi:saccharopine dehydrogenase (NAD+, L-lysine-forming)